MEIFCDPDKRFDTFITLGNNCDIDQISNSVFWFWSASKDIQKGFIFARFFLHFSMFCLFFMRLAPWKYQYHHLLITINLSKIYIEKNKDYGRPMKPFFIEIPNFCAWADTFWAIWGIFGRFISTNFGKVSPFWP